MRSTAWTTNAPVLRNHSHHLQNQQKPLTTSLVLFVFDAHIVCDRLERMFSERRWTMPMLREGRPSCGCTNPKWPTSIHTQENTKRMSECSVNIIKIRKTHLALSYLRCDILDCSQESRCIPHSEHLVLGTVLTRARSDSFSFTYASSNKSYFTKPYCTISNTKSVELSLVCEC